MQQPYEVNERATLSSKGRNALDDSAFAYIDKDGDRHLPIHDAAHVQAALPRFSQTVFDSAADKHAAAVKILAAAKKFGIEVDPSSPVAEASRSADPDDSKTCPLCSGSGKIRKGHRTCPRCHGTGKDGAEKKSAEAPQRNRSMNMQTRAFDLSNVQMRMSDDGNTAHFVGYASMTNVPYHVEDFMGSYDECIRSGAFKKALRDGGNVPLLFNHAGMPIASTASGTMTLSEDERGLKVEADLDRRQSLTNDLCIALERGDLRQMSFKFAATRDKWDPSYQNRDVSELKMFDTSIVTYPASPSTTAALRAALTDSLDATDHARWNAFMKGHEEIDSQVRAALEVLTELQTREGKTISAATGDSLQEALDALHAADDKLSEVQPILVQVNSALDDGQKALSGLLDTKDPDGDPNDSGFEADTTKDAAQGTANAGTKGAMGGPAINPADGAGPRSKSHPRLAQVRLELDLATKG